MNLNRTLAKLRQRPSMDIQHLWSTDRLLDADIDVTFGLLDDIRRSYGGKMQVSLPSPKRAASSRRRRSPAKQRRARPVAVVAHAEPPAKEPPARPARTSSGWAPLMASEKRNVETAQQHTDCCADEGIARRRLHSLGLDITRVSTAVGQRPDLLSDQLRNGTLLCRVVERIDPRCRLTDVVRHPSSLADAISNVELAFQHLRR